MEQRYGMRRMCSLVMVCVLMLASGVGAAVSDRRVVGLDGAGVPGVSPAHALLDGPPDPLTAQDIDLPSATTMTPGGTLAVRVFSPATGQARYAAGAPVVVWVPGGDSVGTLDNPLAPIADDVIVVAFLFPGGIDAAAGRSSDGTYDHRGEACIAALRDVILFAAGQQSDDTGQMIDDVVPVRVLHNNVGLIGASNGGNIAVAAAATWGEELADHLRYVVQWESPVSSQMATTDLGPTSLLCPPGEDGRNDYVNPRYTAYGTVSCTVDMNDIYYDGSNPVQPVFHDGNGNGRYDTVEDPITGCQTPDRNLSGELGLNEDFPLSAYTDGIHDVYSRQVTHALDDLGLIMGPWPVAIADRARADAYWDVREAVRLYGQAAADNPELEGMVLATAVDHVQTAPDKPHIRQAFEGWRDAGAWVRINPATEYLAAADATLRGRTDLPALEPNVPPTRWTDSTLYCLPEDVSSRVSQVAAVWEMADRVQGNILPTPPGGERIVYVESPGIGDIALRIETPATARYPEGAPIVVNTAGWFTTNAGFSTGAEGETIGVISIGYLWPGEHDPISGAFSEGTDDHGGPDALVALRDVLRFASGEIADRDGHTLDELIMTTPITTNVGLYAYSHAGIVATNVLAHHGAALSGVRYFVGGENPTEPMLCSLEVGHWGPGGEARLNPHYEYPDDYNPLGLNPDFSTVGWIQNATYPLGRPYFGVDDGPDHVLGDNVPTVWGKDYYSPELTQALLDNGALVTSTWPAHLATPAEAAADWPYRTSVRNYPLLATTVPDLKVMLYFGARDHVQAAPDKPHIHQAYQGFREGAHLWVRLNPDDAYIAAVAPGLPLAAFTDNTANTQPVDWHHAAAWGHPDLPDARRAVACASVAEMADRVRADEWRDDLEGVLHLYPPDAPTPTPTVTPTYGPTVPVPTPTTTIYPSPTTTLWPTATESPTATSTATPSPNAEHGIYLPHVCGANN